MFSPPFLFFLIFFNTMFSPPAVLSCRRFRSLSISWYLFEDCDLQSHVNQGRKHWWINGTHLCAASIAACLCSADIWAILVEELFNLLEAEGLHNLAVSFIFSRAGNVLKALRAFQHWDASLSAKSRSGRRKQKPAVNVKAGFDTTSSLTGWLPS